MRAEREQDRVAVGRRFRHLGSADIAGGAGDVLDIDLLAELLGELLRHKPREGVSRPTRRKGHDRAHRPGRIGLRPCSARHARQRGRARGQMQKFAAGKFHHLPTAKVDADGAAAWYQDYLSLASTEKWHVGSWHGADITETSVMAQNRHNEATRACPL